MTNDSKNQLSDFESLVNELQQSLLKRTVSKDYLWTIQKLDASKYKLLAPIYHLIVQRITWVVGDNILINSTETFGDNQPPVDAISEAISSPFNEWLMDENGTVIDEVCCTLVTLKQAYNIEIYYCFNNCTNRIKILETPIKRDGDKAWSHRSIISKTLNELHKLDPNNIWKYV